MLVMPPSWVLIFFFNDTATTEIYTLSLHDALPIWAWTALGVALVFRVITSAVVPVPPVKVPMVIGREDVLAPVTPICWMPVSCLKKARRSLAAPPAE